MTHLKNRTTARPTTSAVRKLGFEALEPRRVLAGVGLTAQYFHNSNFTGLAADGVEVPDFNWGLAAPAPGMNAESFSVRWFGRIEAKYTETYTFRTTSEDGVRLWVDGKLLIDDWAANGARVESGTIALQAGQMYDIRVEHYDAAGAAQFRLQWSSPSQVLEIVPAAQLYASPVGLLGAYGDSAGHANSRVDGIIDYNWGTGQAIAGVAADNFTISWSGYIRPDFSEAYQFRTTSDDRVRLWIGDELIIDNWTPHSLAEDFAVKELEAGKWYDIRMEYADVTGAAEIELAWSSARQTEGALAVVPSSNLRAAKETPLYATNPLGPGADPYVVQWGGKYLLVRSGGGGVSLDRADRLEDIHRSTPESSTLKVWTAPAGTNYSSQHWAPELHQINGKWYIYVAASDGDNVNHKMYVLERNAADPYGPYVFKGEITTNPDRWAIDGTVLQWEGQLYFIWSGWPGTTNGQQNLYIAPMSNPWTISGERTLLSAPTYGWERNGLPINEGPQVLIHEGKLHIIYSGSGYWRHEYALGRLTYDGVGDILNPGSWSKSPTPVFKQSGGIVGTGHASFVTSPDGSEHWIIYHAHHDANNWQDDRDIFIQQFTYNPDGTPNFGTPIPKTTPVAVPSGSDVDADRVLVPGDYDASGATNAADLAVLTGLFGLPITSGVSADGDANGFVDGSDFLLWQRNFGATPAAAASVEVASVEAANELDPVVLAEAKSEPAVVASLEAAEASEVESSSPTPLLSVDLIDLAFAANAYWRTETPRDAELIVPQLVTYDRPTASITSHSTAQRDGMTWRAGSTPLRSLPSQLPADEDDASDLDYLFPDLLSASES